jgi:hypothetical protein
LPATVGDVSTLVHALIDLNAALPRVEDPWPDRIGLGFPFSMAGVGGVLGNVLWARHPPEEQNRMAGIGGLWGFRFGAFAYLALSANQLLSFV